MLIESPSNPLIQSVAVLHRSSERAQTGLLLVEGKHPIEEALAAGLTMRHGFHLESVDTPTGWPEAARVTVSERAMARMATTDSPPPHLAVFEAPSAEAVAARWQTALHQGTPLVLVLDRLQDPGNAGTLIRSAVAFGVTGVLAMEGTVDLTSPKVIRASAGLVFALPLLQKATSESLSSLIEAGCRLLGTTGAVGTPSYRSVSFREPCALVLGNEGQGLSPAFSQTPNWQLVTIPMAERVESLNVGVSGSIILAEAAAQRRDGGSP
jgi:TrmH family RNA methyltransferase